MIFSPLVRSAKRFAGCCNVNEQSASFHNLKVMKPLDGVCREWLSFTVKGNARHQLPARYMTTEGPCFLFFFLFTQISKWKQNAEFENSFSRT